MSGAEDVALYVGIVAVALCLTLLLVVLVLVYRRKKEGLDADVADSSILTTGFQPVGIKPAMPGVWAPDRAQRCSTISFLSYNRLCVHHNTFVFHFHLLHLLGFSNLAYIQVTSLAANYILAANK